MHILESREFTTQVLARYPQTCPLLRYMAEPRTWANIAATVNALSALRSSRRLGHAQRQNLLAHRLREERRDPRRGPRSEVCGPVDPLNALLFTQLFGQLLAQPDDKTGRRRTHLVYDEFCVAAGEGKPLAGFADICRREGALSRGPSRSRRGLPVLWRTSRRLYKEAGDAFLGMLQNQVFLRCDPSTADFAVKSSQQDAWVGAKTYE